MNEVSPGEFRGHHERGHRAHQGDVGARRDRGLHACGAAALKDTRAAAVGTGRLFRDAEFTFIPALYSFSIFK